MKPNQLNRKARRKAGIRVANQIIKGREKSMEKKQWGFGFTLTNLLGVVTLGTKVIVLYDHRMK